MKNADTARKFRAVWQQNGCSNPHTGLIGEFDSVSRAWSATSQSDQGVQILIDGTWYNVPADRITSEDVEIWLAGENECAAAGIPSLFS